MQAVWLGDEVSVAELARPPRILMLSGQSLTVSSLL